jgi:hypothetical protein
MNLCKQEFLNKGCMCLADPMDPWKTICAYINRENGLVYPCDTGCCVPRCQGQGSGPRFDVEIRPSGGVTLPPGFGGPDLPQSDTPTEIKGAAPFNFDAGWKTEGLDTFRSRKVWHLVLSGAILLILIFFACWALE